MVLVIRYGYSLLPVNMDQQQLLLWQWSSAVQVTSLAMIAAFFALLARFNPRAELRWWTFAWLANLVALTSR